MSTVTLQRIEKKNTTVRYIFSSDGEISGVMSGDDFIVDWHENIENVPDAVLAVPFVADFLPLIWLSDAELNVPELDEDFYCSIPEFKKGFIAMYRDASFLGKVTVGKTVICRRENMNGSGVFFSAGMDSTATFIRHLDEKPDLLSVWGADVQYDNEAGWKPVQKAIDETAEAFGVRSANIRSSMRDVFVDSELEKRFRTKLHESWWPGVQCGLALLGLAAPYVWLHNLNKVYFAASFSHEYTNILSGTDPSIDNYVRYCGAEVIHDGFELNREQKAELIADFHKKNPDKPVKLHVCWQSTDGNNCCSCEKCYRTMASFWSVGAEPRDFGMNYSDDVWENMYRRIALEGDKGYVDCERKIIQQTMLKNKNMLQKKPYYNKIKWMESFDFEHPEKNWCRIWHKFFTFRWLRKFGCLFRVKSKA